MEHLVNTSLHTNQSFVIHTVIAINPLLIKCLISIKKANKINACNKQLILYIA